MKSIVIIALLLFVGRHAAAQEPHYKKYDWKAPVAAPESDTSENAIILENNTYLEYFYNPDKKNNLDLVRTLHRRVLVNTDQGINQFNTISFYYNPDEKIITIKARTTDRQGKVTEFTKENLREVDGEQGRMLNFPIDGVKKGDVIEYIYQVSESPTYWDRSYVQYETPVHSYYFELISPENLVYDCKNYNLQLERRDTSYDERNYTIMSLKNIPKIKEEKYMYTQPHRGRIDIKLAKNTARSQARMFTWTDAAQRIFEGHYTMTKQETAAVKKYLKGLKMPSGMDAEAQIRWIELKVKNDISIQRGAFVDLVEVIRNKVGSPKGITRLFAALFQALEIEHELVFTSARDEIKFDQTFDHWSVLDEYLMYFPETGKFMSPDDFGYRYPYVDAMLTGTDGLFISQVKIGDVLTGLGKIKYIKPLSAEENTDVLYIDIKLDTEKEAATLLIDHGLGGLSGAGFVPYLGLMQAEQADEICERILKSDISDARLKMEPYSKEMTAAGFDKRFHLKGEVVTNELVEVAGDKLLFNIGQSIGRQTELYQEFDRVYPVENTYNKKYIREITMEIPSGYVIRNADALKFNVVHQRGDKVINLFKSDYTIENGRLKIILDEFYTDIYMGADEFEDFKAVINAAADFQKVKLVLEKG